MGHLPWRLASSWIWRGERLLLSCFFSPQKPCSFPQEIKYSKSILITKAFSGYIPKETRLSCWHYVSIYLSNGQFSVPSCLLNAFRSYPTDRERGRSCECWVGRVDIKILSSVLILCNHSTDLHGRSASLWGLRGNTAKRWCFFSFKKKKLKQFITRCCIASETFSFSTYVTYIPSGEGSY